MSKLIVEMEMPKTCEECPISDFFHKPCAMRNDETAGYDQFHAYKKNERPSWCPIVGVLPEQHGDLIYRDELLKECYHDDEFDAHVIYADDIQKAKAVIAAERKDDGNI